MTSGPVIIGLDQPARSHYARGATRREPIQLAGCKPLHPVMRSHSLAARNESASFSSRAPLKFIDLANTMFDIAAGLLIALFVILLFASPFVAGFCLLFL